MGKRGDVYHQLRTLDPRQASCICRWTITAVISHIVRCGWFGSNFNYASFYPEPNRDVRTLILLHLSELAMRLPSFVLAVRWAWSWEFGLTGVRDLERA